MLLVQSILLGVWQSPTSGAHTHAHAQPHPCPWVLGGHGFDIIGHGRAWVSSALPVNWDTNAKFIILLWWKLKGIPTFPIMSRVARLVLCIPTSSSKLESNFSDAGNTLTKKRSGLKPTTMNDLYLSDPTKSWCRRVIHITHFLNTWAQFE
jgi:hypothetical protein